MKNPQFSSIRKYLLILSILAVFNSAKAQQIPFYSQYYINPFLYNPAATGLGNNWNTFVVHRNQWTGFSGAPVTSALTVDGPIKSKKIGLGASLYNDVTGITHRVGGYITYSYRMDFTEASRLYFGLSAGILSNQIDFTKQKVQDQTEGSIENQFDTKTAVDATFGLLYEYSKLQVGFSVPQLIANSLGYVNSQDTRTYYTLNRHYLGTLKYTFDINKEKGITVYPLILARMTQGVPLQYDANIVLDWKKVGWFAVSYKDKYAAAINLGLRWNGLSIGYAYDIITSDIASYTGGSSEILLGYTFKMGGGGKNAETETASGSGNPDDTYERRMLLMDKRLKQLQEDHQKDKELIDTLEEKINQLSFTKEMVPEVGVSYRLKQVNFTMKSTVLDKKSKRKLDDLVEFMNVNPTVKIAINGHTDDVGEPENNQALSEERAKEVYDYLIEKGIEAERLSYKGYGESQPLVNGTDNESRAKNRRTEILILSK